MPKISVMMSVFNERREWLEQAVESILGQTEGNFEFIIVVDNPELNVECRAYLEDAAKRDGRIRLIYNERNLGLARCMNLALSRAEGKYIARMDADDISMPKRFERELECLEANEAGMVASLLQPMDEDGNPLNQVDVHIPDVERCLPYSNYIVHPSVLIRAEVLRGAGGYRYFRTAQDYDLWLRLLQANCKIVVLEEKLVRYRMRSGSISSQRRMEQFYTAKYQRALYRQRGRHGSDDYSEQNYLEYLAAKRITPHRQQRFERASVAMARGREGLRQKNFSEVLQYFRALWNFPDYFFTRAYLKLAMKFALARHI